MPEPLYSHEAAKVLDQMESDSTAIGLWNAVCDAIDLIADHSGSAEARRYALRTAMGTSVWQVPVRSRTDDWSILWHQDGAGDIVIVYIGPTP